jgi:hypothetical protein
LQRVEESAALFVAAEKPSRSRGAAEQKTRKDRPKREMLPVAGREIFAHSICRVLDIVEQVAQAGICSL